MTPILDFYQNKIPSSEGYSLEYLQNLDHLFIANAYFYIGWLFPINESSKWNKHIPRLTEQDIAYFRTDPDIQMRYLHSVEAILDYFGGCIVMGTFFGLSLKLTRATIGYAV